jgi:dipeptidyl aminopeptidase/acylaminoacyl peptidase
MRCVAKILRRVLLGTAFMAIAAQCQTERPLLRPEDLLRVSHVARMIMSPDGSRLLVRLDRQDITTNRTISNWVLVNCTSKLPPVRVPEQWDTTLEEREVGWAPDSTGILFLYQEEGNTYLQELNVDTFTETRLSNVPLATSELHVASSTESWSRDGRYFLYLVARSPNHEGHPIATNPIEPSTGINADSNWIFSKNMPDAARDQTEVDQKTGMDRDTNSFQPNELWALDVKAGSKRMLSNEGLTVSSYAWQSDHEISYFERDRSANQMELVRLDINSTRHSRLGEYRDIDQVTWSPDGSELGLFSGEKLTFISTAPNRRNIVIDLTHSMVTRDFKREPGPAAWSTDGKQVLLVLWGHMKRALFEVSIETGGIQLISGAGDKWYSSLCYSPRSEWTAVVREDLGEPEQVYLLDRDSWTSMPSFDPNADLRKLPWPTVKEISWLSSDKTFTIHGLLLSPAHDNVVMPHPLLVVSPGGPGPVLRTFDVDGGDYPIAALAANGYIVLVVNSRGRGGYGERFYKALHDEDSRLAKPVQDVLAGIDLLVKRGIADPQRLGMMGFSYGGAMTAWAACATGRFRAVSIGEGGPLDEVNGMFQFSGNPEYRAHLTDELGFRIPYRTAERRRIEEESPLYHVEDVHTPSIYEGGILSDAADDGRRWYQAMQFFHVPSELVVYPRSGHGLREPVLILDSYRRNIDWFDFWLKDRPYPDKRRQSEYDAWKAKRVAAGDPRWTKSGIAPPPKQRSQNQIHD